MSRPADSTAADLDTKPGRVAHDKDLRWEMWCPACGNGRGAVLALCIDETAGDLRLQADRHNDTQPGHRAVVRRRGRAATPAPPPPPPVAAAAPPPPPPPPPPPVAPPPPPQQQGGRPSWLK